MCFKVLKCYYLAVKSRRHFNFAHFCCALWPGALAFAELGAVVPRSGAEYAYFIEAFGKMHPFWGPLPSFVCAWVYVMVLRPAEVAVIILTFSKYVFQPFEESLIGEIDKDYRAVVLKLIALVALGMKNRTFPPLFAPMNGPALLYQLVFQVW